MKQFMKDFWGGFKEGVLDLLWLVEEIWMWTRVVITYVISAVLTIPAAITQFVVGFVLMIGMLSSKEGSKIRGLLEDAMIELMFIVGILMIPANIAFSWLIPESYILLLYLRKTEEIKKEKEAAQW